ncbi:MAG: YetF domain-containing protein [Ginsengibacter sp.]
MHNMFFDDWESLLRAFISTVIAYITLVIFIRISGKRTLSKMNAFDFIVTVALGSCLATISLNKNIALAEGALVYFTFIFLQFIITWTSVRVKQVKKIVSGQPALLLYKGELLWDAMKRERITIEEIYLSVRAKGIADLNEIEVIVLETTGDITVISKFEKNNGHAETLKNVSGYPAGT